jgi:exodeoxyribonuclease VII small subunit
MPRNNKNPKKQELRFEEAMESLENIIERMETERIPLDDLLKDYEEGTKLLKLCRDRIETARARIDQINKELGSGEGCLTPLDEDNGRETPLTPETSEEKPNEGIQLL